MQQIPPLIFREKYLTTIEGEILRLLKQLIYEPLQRAMGFEEELINSISDLINAVRSGDVWYHNGFFYGSFNAKITKELRLLGADFNHVKKAWALPLTDVPSQVSFAIAYAKNHIDDVKHRMITTLDNIDLNTIIIDSDTQEKYGQIVDNLESGFQRSIAGIEAISIAPKLTKKQRSMISEQWGNNLNLYIKGWAEENIIKLRETIQPIVLAGGRAKSLEKLLQDNYAQTKAHAKFLARQETGLLMAKFRESRYADVGVRRYRWSGAMDSRERPDHRALQGQVFNFDSPPVTNKKTGARNNPGEDFGCRCVSVGLVE